MKINTTYKSTSETDAILPQPAIALLPLSPEALVAWNDETDLRIFLFTLYEGTGYGSVSGDYFENTKYEFDIWATIFHEVASGSAPSPASINQNITYLTSRWILLLVV